MATKIRSGSSENGANQAVEDVCPWCDQPISHEKFEEILARIEREARDQAATAKKEAAVQVAKAKSEAAVVLERVKNDAQLRAVAARDEGKREAAAEAASKVTEAETAKAAAEKALAAERERHEKAVKLDYASSAMPWRRTSRKPSEPNKRPLSRTAKSLKRSFSHCNGSSGRKLRTSSVRVPRSTFSTSSKPHSLPIKSHYV